MPITAVTTVDRQIYLTFQGAINMNHSIVDPTYEPGSFDHVQIFNWTPSAGDNTINRPGLATIFTIVPPLDNTIPITLKGVSTDVGIPISPSDPTSIAIGDLTVSSIVVTLDAPVHLLIVWA